MSELSVPSRMSVTGLVLPAVLGTRTELRTVRVTVVDVVPVPVKQLTEALAVKTFSTVWAAATKCRGEIIAEPYTGLLVSQPTPVRFWPLSTNWLEVFASGASAGKLVLKRSKRGS